ncbi:hypothetical protein BSZ32_13660 [Rubritalea profundi]|uniref:Uncharacterized protein n=1 Tax=Rubritalea profundi TaxID=1658618 RepID=A0A2S7U358_9BACT|nr:hypothetical protein BSZ32_13660 [Rubritalea profundi]
MAIISAIRAFAWASAIALPFWLERTSTALRLNIPRAIMTSNAMIEIVAIKAKPRASRKEDGWGKLIFIIIGKQPIQFKITM